jgi:hypothetical protein
MKLTDEWQPYDGDYEKEFQAIRCKDGREFLTCWPNAGVFFCEVKTFNILIKEEDVTHVKKGIHPMDLLDIEQRKKRGE